MMFMKRGVFSFCFLIVSAYISSSFAQKIVDNEKDCNLMLRRKFLQFCDNGQELNNYKECLESEYEQMSKYLNIESEMPECINEAKTEYNAFKVQQKELQNNQSQNSSECIKSKQNLSAVEYCVRYAKSLGEFRMRSYSNRYKIDNMCGEKVIGNNSVRNAIYNLVFQKNIIVIDPSLIMLTEDYNKGMDKIYNEYLAKTKMFCGE